MGGKTISHYCIFEKLGEGGMGEVYKAEDAKLKRAVALSRTRFVPSLFATQSSVNNHKVHERHLSRARSGLPLNDR